MKSRPENSGYLSLKWSSPKRVLNGDTADEWLDTWREHRGYYAPVESVTEIVGDEG
jgi:hypothetical protein